MTKPDPDDLFLNPIRFLKNTFPLLAPDYEKGKPLEEQPWNRDKEREEEE